jgi:opacity protein-like surface antigen
VEGRVAAGTVEGSVRNNIFFTPGVRWKFTPASRVSFYAAAGAGLASFGEDFGLVQRDLVSGSIRRVTTGALGFGAGIDIRLTRLVSLRAEGRDLVTRGNIDGSANHSLLMVGAALHF